VARQISTDMTTKMRTRLKCLPRHRNTELWITGHILWPECTRCSKQRATEFRSYKWRWAVRQRRTEILNERMTGEEQRDNVQWQNCGSILRITARQ
jgi:hypothetical protein